MHCCLLGHCWYWFSSFLCFLTIICCSRNTFLYATIFATIQWFIHFASNTFSLFLLFELVLHLLLSLLQHWIFAQVSTTCHGYQKTLCCIGDNHPPHWNTTTFLWGRWNIISIFPPTFGCNCNNNLTQLVNVILHNFPPTSMVVALGFDLGYWVKLQSTTLFFVFYACQIWWLVMDFEFQDVKGHFVWHDQQAKAISCKETHQVSTCDPCGGSSGLCDLQIVPWLKPVDVQWIVCHQQINYCIGYVQSC